MYQCLLSITYQLNKFDDDPTTTTTTTATTTTTNAKETSLICNAGDAIFFDYRMKHRGRANFTSKSRPILYLAYAKPFFRDIGNTVYHGDIALEVTAQFCSKHLLDNEFVPVLGETIQSQIDASKS